MDSGFEGAFRTMLKAVVLEVVVSLSSRPSRSGDLQRDEIAKPGVLLLRRKEAAKALAISEGQLAKLTRFGKLPCMRINRSVRHDVAGLQDWITLDDSPRELESPPARKIGAAKSDVGRKLRDLGDGARPESWLRVETSNVA
jgi:hypothetical protein